MQNEGRYGGFKGAVSLTFDDGTSNQLERVVPILDEYSILGTFYLHARDDLMENHADDWRAVGERGHEIGNHSKSHPCQNAILGNGGGVDDMTLDEIEADILEAHDRLASIAPHQEEWTFAYPCGAMHVGRGLGRQSYVPLIAKHFLAGRALGEYGFGNDPTTMDSAALLSIRVDRMTGFEMIGLVQDLTDRGQWVILCFHDISGVRISVEEDEFRHLLGFLESRRHEMLVAPVADVMTSLNSSTFTT